MSNSKKTKCPNCGKIVEIRQDKWKNGFRVWVTVPHECLVPVSTPFSAGISSKGEVVYDIPRSNS